MIMLEKVKNKAFDYVLGRMMNMENNSKELSRQYDIREQVEYWNSIYNGKPSWVGKEYSLDGKVTSNVKTLGFGASLVSELARLTTIELETSVTGGEFEEYVNSSYQKLVNELRGDVEQALVDGGVIFKPYLENGDIHVECISAKDFIPLKFDGSGRLISVTFIDKLLKDNKLFTRLETHTLENGVYTVVNQAYLGDPYTSSSKRILLSRVPEWSSLEEEVILEGVDIPLFSYFKVPYRSTSNLNYNLGSSVFDRVDGLLEEVDRMYSNILWEYEGSQLAVFSDVALFVHSKLPERQKRLFETMDSGVSTDKPLLDVFSPEIRDSSLFNGLNKLMRRIEFNVGLAYGTLSEVDVIEKTAEEIRSGKERTYSTIRDIQRTLKISLEEVVEIMMVYCQLYDLTNVKPSEDYELTFHFDDSIVVDRKMEIELMQDDVKSGLLKPEYYIMLRYGLSLEEALERIPSSSTEKEARSTEKIVISAEKDVKEGNPS